jgi:hypothetical protein
MDIEHFLKESLGALLPTGRHIAYAEQYRSWTGSTIFFYWDNEYPVYQDLSENTVALWRIKYKK